MTASSICLFFFLKLNYVLLIVNLTLAIGFLKKVGLCFYLIEESCVSSVKMVIIGGRKEMVELWVKHMNGLRCAKSIYVLLLLLKSSRRWFHICMSCSSLCQPHQLSHLDLVYVVCKCSNLHHNLDQTLSLSVFITIM